MKKIFDTPIFETLTIQKIGLDNPLSGGVDGFEPDPSATGGDYGI